MKMVKQRAVTIGRQREMELALERAKAEGHVGGDEELMQGLYSLSQTEVYTPEPIKDVRPSSLFIIFLFLSLAGLTKRFLFRVGKNTKERFRQHGLVRALHVATRRGTYPMYVHSNLLLCLSAESEGQLFVGCS